MTKKFLLKNNRGFTLVEVLLYVSIVSVLVLVMSIFLFMLLEAKTKAETIWEVNSEGARVMRIITQIVRNAETINVPVPGASGTIMTLAMNDSSKNPTVFSSSGSNIQIKEGTGATISLTAGKFSISDLVFENLSRTNTPGVVKIMFTMNRKNISGRKEYSFPRTFWGTAGLR